MRSGTILGAITLLLVASNSEALLISGFTPDLPGGGDDDAFELWNPTLESVPLRSVSVTDGEGELGFPEDAVLAPDARIRIALNATAFREAARRDAEYLGPGEQDSEMREIDKGFQLARAGDEIQLMQDGRLLDAVTWGESVSRDGWTGPGVALGGGDLRWHQRNGNLDTNSSHDWEASQRVFLGWRPHDLPTRFHPGQGTAYTAPDQSRAVVEDLIAAATQSLKINVYEFRDADLARHLVQRMKDQTALRVELLVDASPVGMGTEERIVRDSILHFLEDAGAEVRLFQHGRYGFNHAKYVVADGRFVLVQSENFVGTGIPANAQNGNRGWGILLDDASVAAEIGRLFDHDFALDDWGARGLAASESTTQPLPAPAPADPRPGLGVATGRGFNVNILAGPESNTGSDDAVVARIQSATSEILVEHLQFPPTWRAADGRDWPNAYLEALEDAADRGVHVRVLLDGHFVDEAASDNLDTVDRLDAHPNIEARFWDLRGVLHVKGMVVDGRWSFVGSTNWNLNSVAQNRELTVIVDAPEFAALYGEAFELDWERAAPLDEGFIPFVEPATIISALALATGLARRRT